MTPTTHASSPEMGAKIRARRNELGLTIEEAARTAKIGSETWRRYEAGSAIRTDKARGVCRALRWSELPTGTSGEVETLGDSHPSMWELAGPVSSKGYSRALANDEWMGEACARTFSCGYDWMTDHLEEAIRDLADQPRGTHLGEIGAMLDDNFPDKWLTRYDREFLQRMRYTVEMLWLRVWQPGFDGQSSLTRCVADDLALHLIMESGAEMLSHPMNEGDEHAAEVKREWREWVYLLSEEDDETVGALYSNSIFPDPTDIWHFEHWFDTYPGRAIAPKPSDDEIAADGEAARKIISRLWESDAGQAAKAKRLAREAVNTTDDTEGDPS